MSHDPSRVEAIFLTATEIAEPNERAAFLERECGDDLPLRNRVGALLDSHDEAGDFLQPAASNPELEAEFARLKPEEAGERIGHYKLLQEIGRGGFGTVWMAEQEQPVRRRVALKIIKLGMDTEEVIARFEQERQALAMMDHPNIAKVFDAGATPFGRPFFVMELVRGVKITDYCDQAKLPTAERLQLFISVCQAVQHAHQKGIIHRDLKPSNILVTLHDGVPVPKVIDFGVAKATQARLIERTLFTQFEQMIGTPLYMSPEQAELSGLDIDTRSDIYSLGVLLYELLTGRTPVDRETLERAGYDEIRRIIREQEPSRPSTALQTMAADARTVIAESRHTEPPKLLGLLRGDLDWIVMKALEKDRTRRYETANGFAQDIKRHLAHEPVLARPPSSLYRLRRMARRNRLAFAAGAAVVLAILIGGAISTVLFFREKAEREHAEIAEHRAEGEAARANRALAELKKTAPTLLALAESEASVQHFDSAHEKLDAALALDPDLRPAYWRRAWILIGQERFTEAVQAMRAAQEKDRAQTSFAPILTLIDEIAAAPEAGRWRGDTGSRLLTHLKTVGASGEAVALARKFQLSFPEKARLVKARIAEWLGPDSSRAIKNLNDAGEIEVSLPKSGIDSLEPLRGLPITRLDVSATKVTDLAPLRGMALTSLKLSDTAVTELSALQGMPLQMLWLGRTKVRDLNPLKGAPLVGLDLERTPVSDFSPLRGMPLTKLGMMDTSTRNLGFLEDCPIEELDAHINLISDLTPLRGKPLRRLVVSKNKIKDLSPLRGAPIEELLIHDNPVQDLAPLLDLPKLKRISVSHWGKLLEPLRKHPTLKFIADESGEYRPASEFWAGYDAEQQKANQ